MLKKLSVLVLICFVSFASKAEVIVTDSTETTMLGQNTWVLNSSKELSFEEVRKSNDFEKNVNEIPNLGISATSRWIKFTITNRGKSPDFFLHIAYPILDELELYSPSENGSYQRVLMGEILDFNARKYKNLDYIFDLNIPENKSNTYYLRVKSSEQIILPISVNKSTSLWKNLNEENLLTGIFLGAVFIMFLYNLFIFFSVKDRSYIYYVIYVAFVGLTQIGIKGVSFKYLWPNSPAFELRSVVLFACISSIAALLFTQKFLRTKENAKKSHVVLTVIIIMFILAFLITCFGFGQLGFQLMQVSTNILVISTLAVSFMVMKDGYQPAKFILISWTVLVIGAIIFALKDFGILPYNTFTAYSMQGASVIEMAFLSFGLADRINILKKEKEASQALALSIAKENERIIREQNVILEAKVNDRTSQLVAANAELNTTLENLQQAQIQLVESEKMASLGQLTAGIAHEINNPINFVTSNVAPLQRDVDILMDAVETIQQVGLSEASVIEKQKQIDDYKEEVDYDYLKIEIKHLLKGIKEGASRTAEIVKGLRVFSRLDEDDLKHANINECLESTMVIVNNLLGENIKVHTNYTDLPLVECYPGKLNQVFLNVISNAVHAIKKRYPDAVGGELSIETASHNHEVVVSISDNGIGMDDNTMKKIFEPFFTTKDVGEGTGLGMSIAYNTIKKHNGNIEIDSAVGRGSKFTITLPLVHQINET